MEILKNFSKKKYAPELTVGIITFIFYLVKDLINIFFR